MTPRRILTNDRAQRLSAHNRLDVEQRHQSPAAAVAETPPHGLSILLAPDNRPASPPKPQAAPVIAGGQGHTAAGLYGSAIALSLLLAALALFLALAAVLAVAAIKSPSALHH